MRRFPSLKALPLILLALAGAAAPAHAAGLTWATVNVCSGNQVGVRASMPGDGSTDKMQARFSLQWWSGLRGNWVGVAGQAQSPWRDAGSARYEWAQEGWTFSLTQIPPGARMRGVAELRWTRGGQVTRTTSLVTQGGAGAASCLLQR